ncbi:hypothetical protein [Maricaulis sp.]|uniref:hypothetical protein n=1 Tax=Maricaulis sp. TaxID=1486257 RepID=UPI003A91B32B
MKTPRLPQTDFANYAMLPSSVRASVLKGHSTYVPPYTLEPFRKSLTEICNVQQGLFQFEPSPLEIVLRHVRSKCQKHPKSEGMCTDVAEALWEHVQEKKIYCEARIVERVSMGAGWSVNYWHDFYMVEDGKLISPFFDGRKGQTRLNHDGALFVCSMIHHFLARGRFRNLVPRVYQFPERKHQRVVEVIEFERDQLLGIDELEERVTETAALWNVIVKNAA